MTEELKEIVRVEYRQKPYNGKALRDDNFKDIFSLAVGILEDKKKHKRKSNQRLLKGSYDKVDEKQGKSFDSAVTLHEQITFIQPAIDFIKGDFKLKYDGKNEQETLNLVKKTISNALDKLYKV